MGWALDAAGNALAAAQRTARAALAYVGAAALAPGSAPAGAAAPSGGAKAHAESSGDAASPLLQPERLAAVLTQGGEAFKVA